MNTNRGRTPADTGHEKGVKSEKRGVKALLIMAKHGDGIKELEAPPVLEVRQTKRYSKEDQNGIDAVAILEGGYRIPVSITSSERGKHSHDRHFRMRWARGLFVAVKESVLVRPKDRMRDVICTMCDYINRVWHAARRAKNRILYLEQQRREKAARKRQRFVRFFGPSMCH